MSNFNRKNHPRIWSNIYFKQMIVQIMFIFNIAYNTT